QFCRLAYFCVFISNSAVHHLSLHSFPTRRSSDLISFPSYGNKNPPVPALTFGDAPWDQGLEVYTGILRGIRVYSTNLSLTDIQRDRKSTRLNSSHVAISYAVFCSKKKNDYLGLSA